MQTVTPTVVATFFAIAIGGALVGGHLWIAAILLAVAVAVASLSEPEPGSDHPAALSTSENTPSLK